MSLTNYKIVWELSRRVKIVVINAASPMEAFKKFKEMMPKSMYDNLSVHDIEEQINKPKVKELKCFKCSGFNIKKVS